MTARPTRATGGTRPPTGRHRAPRRPGTAATPGGLGPVVTALPAALLAALVALVLLPAKAQGVGPPGAAAAATGSAWIRAGHFVPGFGAARIDLVALGGPSTGVTMSPDAAYGDVTAYQKIAAGSYTVTLRPQGAALSEAPLLQRSFTVTSGSASTIAAVGRLSAPRLTILTDDLTPTPAGTARVRVLAASSVVPSLTVVASGGPTLASGAVLGQTTGYTTVASGRWQVTAGGGDRAATSTAVVLAAGSVYTAVVLDADGSVRLELVSDAAGAAAMPQGGARTGSGWLAAHAVTSAPSAPSVTSAPGAPSTRSAGPPGAVGPPLATAAAAGLLLALGVRRRRRGAGWGPG